MRGLRALVILLPGLWLQSIGLLPAAAQFRSPALDIAGWTVRANPAVVHPGGTWRLEFEAEFAEASPGDGPWRMYALGSPPPSRAIAILYNIAPGGFGAADLRQKGTHTGYDQWFETDVVYFEEKAFLWADLVSPSDATPGEHAIRGSIDFLLCNDRICLPPSTSVFETTVVVRPEVAAGASSVPAKEPVAVSPTLTTPTDVADPPDDVTGGFRGGNSLWAFLLLAIGAGMGAFLMPCVYPMIPLTVSYFTKHTDRLAESVRMSLVYGLAIVTTFTGLGVAMAALVKGAGAQSIAANPWVNLGIGVVFIVFAVSLLGLFELRLPQGIVQFVNRRGAAQSGYVGVFFMGFTLTLVSFSCTVPFVGLLLPAIAGGAWFYPVLGMFVFSLTFSLPFMLFALFPRALTSLPNAGSWMQVLKVVFGFIELAAALKFLSNADIVWGFGAISRTLAIALCIVIFTLAGFYLVGKLHLHGDPVAEHVGVGRLLLSIVFFGLSLYLLPGLLGAPLNKLDAYLPPRQSDDVSLVAIFGSPQTLASHDEGWITDDIEAAFTAAEDAGKPVMIDFTGYTCTNCREMEANVFTKPDIASRFERDFVLLRLYTDGPLDTQLQQYQLDLTGTVALPTYAIVAPEEPEKPILQISGVVSEDRFAAFLAQGIAAYAP